MYIVNSRATTTKSKKINKLKKKTSDMLKKSRKKNESYKLMK